MAIPTFLNSRNLDPLHHKKNLEIIKQLREAQNRTSAIKIYGAPKILFHHSEIVDWASVGIHNNGVQGVGDLVQFTSLPENFFKNTGEKLIDFYRNWVFDHNPYVRRDIPDPKHKIRLFNFPKQYEWPRPHPKFYNSNAELHASVFNLKTIHLQRPRFYIYEDFPYFERKNILFHIKGRSQGILPNHVIEHVVKKYNHENFYQVGGEGDPDIQGVKRIRTTSIWELAKVISEARMFIGVDSGPSWIACAYPDVQLKKIRRAFKNRGPHSPDYMPLDIDNHESHWDDISICKIYNCENTSTGYAESYLKI